MNSTPDPEQSCHNDVVVAALELARQQLRHPGRQLRCGDEQVSEPESNSGPHTSELQKRVPPHRSLLGRRASISLLAATCIGAAAMILRSHGDAAEQVTEWWKSQLYLISSPASKATPAQSALPAPPAQTTLAGSAPTAAGVPPEPEQLAQLLRGFLAVVEQDIGDLKASIEQLKASQEQMVRNNSAVAEQLKAAQEQIVRDNAAVVEQLKASQEQMARLIAKDAEQQLRPKTSAAPSRPIATSGKTMPKLSSPQTSGSSQ